ncbi:hypothetical protein [Aneurinibacillus tyrosinisolvens]|uniref:hypothetical protein n=1 Tax=Aneurinibacillus tyrosinisolvens TaxID=1443435 RepID=UPI00063F0D9D|nr:hypothetical protein [Aneurinibacillus tyrosinisolvens]
MNYEIGQILYSIGKQKGLWKVNVTPYFFNGLLEKDDVSLQFVENITIPYKSDSKRTLVKKKKTDVFLTPEEAEKECESRNEAIFSGLA